MPHKPALLAGPIRSLAIAVAFIVLITALMLWLSGRFSPKVAAGESVGPAPAALSPGDIVVPARTIQMLVTEPAVGTIRAQHETTVASHILARVIEINLKAGQMVKQGDVLVRLDDTDLKARLQQAQAAADAARAIRDNAAADERRYASALQANSVSQVQYDLAAATLRSHEASLSRANQAIAEAQAVLEYATIRSPMDGVVVDKRMDVGDTATPGQPLLTIYDPQHMQLIASVRESQARRLKVGQSVDGRLDVMDKSFVGQVSEIVPDAQSASRTFQVKVTGPSAPGLYTGMFGRIFVPLDNEDVLVIPRTAVSHVGQLELVNVLIDGVSRRRAVRVGKIVGDDCEVLSGLAAGEKVIVPENTMTTGDSPAPVSRPAEPGRP